MNQQMIQLEARAVAHDRERQLRRRPRPRAHRLLRTLHRAAPAVGGPAGAAAPAARTHAVAARG